MIENLTFILVGQMKFSIQDLINTFIGKSNQCFEKKISSDNCVSAQIKIQDKNIELNLVNINSHLTEYKGPNPSAVLFVYNMGEEETFKALNNLLQK